MNNIYKCRLCGKIVNRDSDKKWIKSYCDQHRKYSRLMRIELNDKLIDELCKEFLPNYFELSSFKEREILLLESAFSQGAAVMMNLLKNGNYIHVK